MSYLDQSFVYFNTFLIRYIPEFWGIVNNAGIGGIQGPFNFNTSQDYRDVFEVNVIGVTDVIRTFVPLLRQSGGRIVNTASGMALMPFPSAYPYLASKYAIRAITAALR